MRNNDINEAGLSRRDLLSNAAAATGALVVGFWMPPRAAAQIINPEGATWAIEPDVKEINAWVVVAPDETVTIRIAQTELGSSADPHQVSLGMDIDGHRAEESRCPAESHWQNHLRHRRQTARHEMGGRQDLPGLWRQSEEL